MHVNGVRLNVKDVGEGVPLVWGHGLTLSMAFEDTVDWFRWSEFGSGARLVRYDARGHGASEATYVPRDYHWSHLAGDMVAVADGLGCESFLVGGQSMGCATSIYAALAAPERVRAVVLVNPPTAWETRAAKAAVFDEMAAKVEAQGSEVMEDMLRQKPLWPDWMLRVRPEVNEANLRQVRAMPPRALAHVLRGARICDLPPREELSKITMPALILAWVDDKTHPMATAEELKARLPESRLIVAENPDEIARWPRIVMDFVRSAA